MKHSVLFKLSLLSLLFSLLAINVQAQGFTVHEKNKSATYYPHERVDSIVFSTTASTDKPSTDTPAPTSGTAIDLGLSVKWAAYNVGATVPEEYGGYYAWGELGEKSNYDRDTYQYKEAYIGDNISGTQYDVARAKWGDSWRMPTLAEFKELDNKCKWEWATYNGVDGRLVTGPNGNSIFFPAAGNRDEEYIDGIGSIGRYWSGTFASSKDGTYGLYFYDSDGRLPGIRSFESYYGRSVRPVSD